MSNIRIRIYEGEGIEVRSLKALIETTLVNAPHCDLRSGRCVAMLLEREHPEFRSDSGILIYKVTDGWASSRSLRRITGGKVHYFWQDAVVSAD